VLPELCEDRALQGVGPEFEGRIMARTIVGLLLVSALFLGGCGIKASSDFMPGTNFNSYRTFAQSPPPTQRVKSLPGYSEILGRQIRDMIASDLQSKGYRSVAAEDADLLVAFSVSGQPRTDVVGGGVGYYGWGGGTYTQHYVVGRLVVDIFDNRSKKLLWHGWADKEIFGTKGDGKGVERVVQAVMKEFPPEQG
jgi:hypothetical protein